jgi:dihydrofolate reductase
MTVSLDGYIADPGGAIDWSVPTEELHRFHNERVGELGGHFLGRRLYETMLYWETPDEEWGEIERDFARIWNPLPKVVFSSTLEQVEGSARLASAGLVDEVARMREETHGDLGVGGATLAAAFTELDLIDDYELFVSPVVLGGGTPFFAPSSRRLNLELIDNRIFGEIVYLHYRRR